MFTAALGAPETALLAGLAGLLVGSFLNVVIRRVPIMLERDWAEQCAELARDAEAREAEARGATATAPSSPPFNVIEPRSHCPHCRAPIAAKHLVPVLSWLVLHGRCSSCSATIGARYPLVELGTAIIFAVVALRFPLDISLLGALTVSGFLIALAMIDFDTHYLPDQLTLPLLWLGLAASVIAPLTPNVDPTQAILGAIAGYLSLWSVHHAFRLLTGKEGMGYGDFKLLAALGAWLGMPSILPIVLLAAIAGSIVGLVGIFAYGRHRDLPIAFGPFLAAAGWLVMTFG